MITEKEYYVVCATEKEQKRDEKGKFLKKRKKFLKNNCPKSVYTWSLDDAKLFGSHSKASFAINSINKITDKKYDIDVLRVKKTVEIN